MARVRILRGTVIDGRERFPGDVVEVGLGDLRLLIATGKVVVHADDAPVADMGHRDPVQAPQKRGRR